MTPRTPIWSAIAETLRAEIGGGLYPPGTKLPTEAVLAARFGVNRHTLRRAVKDLTEDGILHPRRGAGVFVASVVTDYPIGRRVRFHQNLLAVGQTPARQILLRETRQSRAEERDALQLPQKAQVHICEGLSLADGQPIALFRSAFPADRFPGLPDMLAATLSVTAALGLAGVVDYTRASTRIDAKLASATQALHLRIPERAPILRTIGINVDPDGRPVEYGRTWFAGDRVTLTMADG